MAEVAEIKKLVKALNAEGMQGSKADILGILQRLLKEVVATEALLKETKVGVAVSKQRSNPDKEISELAKTIVKKWKSAVRPADEAKGSKSAASGVKSESASAAPSPAAGRSPLPSTPTSSTPTAVSSATLNNITRTTKTDGVKIPTRNDKVRDKCCEMIYDALASDSNAPSELILKKATGVETCVFDEFGDVNAGYRNKMRRLFLNLKDKNNKRLRESVADGDLAVDRFCSMSPQEMASEERRQADKALEEVNMFKSLGAQEQEAETDAFKCGRCKQRKTRYRQAQTRSADEPMTTFVTCVNCGNRWKFS